MGKNKSKSSSSDGLPLMGLIKPAVGVAVALAGYYFLQGIQTEVSIRPCAVQTITLFSVKSRWSTT